MTTETLSIKHLHRLTAIGIRTLQIRCEKEQWPCLDQPGKGRGGRVRRFYLDSLPDDLKLLLNKAKIQNLAITNNANQHTVAFDSVTIESLTEKQIAIGSAKADLLMQYNRAIKLAKYGKKGQARKDFMLAYNSSFAFPKIFEVLGEVSWKTIEGWKCTLKSGGNLTSLADYRGKWRRGKTKVTSQQARILLECALHPNRWLISEVIREAQRRMHALGIDNGHSENTYRRWIENFKAHNYDIWCFQRGGEKRFNDECCLSIERNPELINVGDVLVADGHKLNFEILSPWTGKPQRMTLIVFYDMRSSYPCGWEIMPTENTAAISAALRRAIITLGKIPRVVYLDNGRAFKAKCFTESDIDLEQSGLYGLYAQLGIQTVFAWPYHGQSKTVERFFGTLSELERLCPTYVGTGIDKKPPRLLRGERLHRKVYENVMAGKYLTLEMAHRAVAAWFDEYARRPQERSKYLNGDAPIDLFEPGRGQGVDPVKLTYLMWSKKEASIRASRIGFQGNFYYHEELEGRRHKVEIRYDLQDPGYVAVFENGRFLCIATEQDQVHPMATHLGNDQDRALLAKYCEIKARQKKTASTLARQLLENEVLPAHNRRLERDGVTALGPPVEPTEEKPKPLTAADARRIESEVARYRKTMAAEKADPWAELESLAEAEKYERLVRFGARGVLIPRQYQAFMRYFEQTGKYNQLEKSGYWENVRTSEIIMNRATGTHQTQGAINV